MITLPRLLLVDDDPIFCRSMKQTAKLLGIELSMCQNLRSVLNLPSQKPFDVALLDYHFGDLTAYHVGHFLAEKTPIVIISQYEAADSTFSHWALDIRKFISKSSGNDEILKSALRSSQELIPTN